jgi:hypothetical protein
MALSQYKTTGFVNFNSRSQAVILSEFGCNPLLVARAMYLHVNQGGEVRRIREQGDASVYQNEFHDDLVFPFRGQELYAETLFFDYPHEPDWGRIEVVDIKVQP